MTTMQVTPSITFQPLTVDHPTIKAWLAKLRLQNPQFSHEKDPQKWMGLIAGDRVLAAMAHSFYDDGTILISGIMCEPSRAGRKAADALWLIMKKFFEGRRVVCFVSSWNRKMLKAMPAGSRVVARMMEVKL